MKLLIAHVIHCAVLCTSLMTFTAQADDLTQNNCGFLSGTVYEKVGTQQDLDPYLLYAVSLLESASKANLELSSAYIAPNPYAIRGPQGAIYPKTLKEAKRVLKEQIAKWGKRKLDVGLMQINGQHWHRLKDPYALLDPYTNVSLGAQILHEVLNAKNHNDLELAIGHYHSPTEWRARSYGSRVLAVYENLKDFR